MARSTGAFSQVGVRFLRSFFRLPADLPKHTRVVALMGILLVVFTVVIALVFALSNLWLSSSWGAGVIARKVEQKAGIPMEIGSARWSPWAGLSLKDVTVELPSEYELDAAGKPLGAPMDKPLSKPIVSVAKVQVLPYWPRFFRGKLELKKVTVDRPHIHVSIEMLAAMAQRYQLPAVSPKVAESEVDKSKVKDTAKKAQQSKGEENPAMKSDTAKSPEVSPKKAAADVATRTPQPQSRPQSQAGKQVAAKKAVMKALTMEQPLWLEIRDAEVIVVSVKQQLEVLSLKEVSIEAPVFGDDAEGVIKIGKTVLLGESYPHQVQEVIKWEKPFLSIGGDSLAQLGLELGFKTDFEARLLLRRGRPKATGFDFSLGVDQQSPLEWNMFKQWAVVAEVEKMSVRLTGKGALFNPLAWRGSLLVEAEHVRTSELHGKQSIDIDEVYVPALFSGGQLRWSGVRVIGEDLAVLGNGSVGSSGKVLAVTRLVVSPEIAEEVTRALHGAMIPGGGHRWWKDLDTPDRQIRDIVLSGDLRRPMINVSSRYEDIAVSIVLEKIRTFIRREMHEEGKVLQAVPNHEIFRNKAYENH